MEGAQWLGAAWCGLVRLGTPWYGLVPMRCMGTPAVMRSIHIR